MSDTYGYGGMGGNNLTGNNPAPINNSMGSNMAGRDRITQALMQINNPPPGGAQGMGGVSGQMPGGLPGGGMPPQPSPMQASRPLPGGAMPQAQPAGFGALGPPATPMGPIGGPYQPGMNLPGITPAGVR
jgi:hypothetical protein